MALRLICELCEGRRVTGHDAVDVHVTMHRLIDEPCQVWWVVADGLVLRRAQDEQR
jgi:hypothetical protein